MPEPLPHQIEGAKFLANRRFALLADEPRVGKTGAAIIACDYVFAARVLVITKSSARAQWGKDFREWQSAARTVQVIYKSSDKIDPKADVVVVGWGMVFRSNLLSQLRTRSWDALILDESHEAKNPTSQRAEAAYSKNGLINSATLVWCLTGTPFANAPNDIWTALNAMSPARLLANASLGWPDVSTYEKFCARYCVMRRKFNGGHWIEYAIKGKNEEELAERLKGFWLRRTQEQVGIRPPIYSVFPLHADKLPPELKDIDSQAVFAALEAGERADDVHLAKVRRITGQIKASLVVEAAKEMLDDGLDKLVLMAWHSDVIDALKEGLSWYGVVGVDGRTPPTKRHLEVAEFQTGRAKVFIGQIQAAGEAIDLSASAELWFVEPSFTPKDMKQASLRITNHTQKRQALVRVCALENSIDEAAMDILTRKVASIKLIMEN